VSLLRSNAPCCSSQLGPSAAQRCSTTGREAATMRHVLAARPDLDVCVHVQRHGYRSFWGSSFPPIDGSPSGAARLGRPLDLSCRSSCLSPSSPTETLSACGSLVARRAIYVVVSNVLTNPGDFVVTDTSLTLCPSR